MADTKTAARIRTEARGLLNQCKNARDEDARMQAWAAYRTLMWVLGELHQTPTRRISLMSDTVGMGGVR